MPATSPGRRWLMLTAVVLLAHLALMHLFSDTLAPLDPVAGAAATFATRTLSERAALAPLIPSEVAHTRAKPQPKTRPSPVKPAHPSRPTEAPQVINSTEPVTTQAEPLPADPTVAATAPQDPASAPERVQAADVTPAPAARALHFNPQSLSASTRLTYTLKTSKFPFSLNAELLWLNQGQEYNARLRYSAFGQSRMQSSQGSITNTGLAPVRFADKYRSEVAAHFNEAQGKITFSANTPDVPLMAGAQDRLSVLIQLGALIASEPNHFEPGTAITVQTAGPRSAEVWLFTVMPAELLELPGGAVQGLKLERQPREPYDQKVEVWLSPQLGYLPARIRITDANGDSADQQWRATEPAEGAN